MHGRLAPSGLWWKWIRVQWVIGIGLIPLSLFIFQEFSLVSFLANNIAIPWLGLLVLPFCFLSIIFLFISPTLTKCILYLANESLELLWKILNWFANLSFASWHVSAPSFFILLLSCIGIVILLLPTGFPGRWLGIAWLLPLFFHTIPIPNESEYWVNLLDVGQGLAIVIQTKSHLLIYDAGPKFSQFDAGNAILLPFLYQQEAKKINMLVVSHGDNDHIGGTQALLTSFPVLQIKTSVPTKFSQFTTYCLAGESWIWDHVKFSFLYPNKEDIDYNNDSSCVLKIDNGIHSTLLTGDIEKYAEEKLLANNLNNLSADLLVAPHHGSKTSGLLKFIEAVHPSYVLYATGYKNRYHFPHPSVVETYR